MGNHSETIQIDYDPTQISYEDLLEVFWSSHRPTSRPWSRQYASIVFYHNEEQRQAAEKIKARREAESGRTIYTEIVPFNEFYLAEDYHQKYYLRQERSLVREFQLIYPDLEDFVDSTAVTRANGYVAGNGSLEQLQAELNNLGLSHQAQQTLLDIASRYN